MSKFLSINNIAWDYFVSLNTGGDNIIEKCLETLSLEEFDATDLLILNKVNCFNDNSIINYSQLNYYSASKFLFCSCFYGESVNIPDFLNWFESLDLPADRCELLIFSDAYLKIGNQYAFVHVPSTSENEFQKKIARHIENFVSRQPLGSRLNPFKEKFTDQKVIAESVSKGIVKYDKKYILSLCRNNMKLDMHCHFVTGSKKLLVLGQDALTRSRVVLPHFFRWRWVGELPVSTIILNDPTLYLDDSLNGGWFVGDVENDYAKDCAFIIKEIADILGVGSKITFYGASAGGFSSLMLASCLEGSKAIVDIPQVDLLSYHVKSQIEALAKVAFSVEDLNEFPKDLAHRVNVIDRFRYQQRIPDIAYMHNVNDIMHVDQFNYFLSGWSELAHELPNEAVGKLEVNAYSRWHLSKGGHFPKSKNDTIKEILSFI